MRVMTDRLYNDLVIAVALGEFLYRYQSANPELSRRAWLLAIDQLSRYDIDPYQSIDALANIDTLRELEASRTD